MRRPGRLVACLAALAWIGGRPARAAAQAVVIDGPGGTVLNTLTPTISVRALGFRNLRPLSVQLQVAATNEFTSLVVDSTFTTNDSVFTIVPSRPFPSETQVWWRVRVRGSDGQAFDSPATGPRTVPAWITLVTPNSASGNSFDIRRPLFVWRAASVASTVGPWVFDLEITSSAGTELTVTGLRDTTYRPTVDLQANKSYRWNLRGTLRGTTIRVISQGTFVISDPEVPTTTLLFQNFPNPFPSPTAFSTCFWFDVGQGGAKISLDIRDLRGNLVKVLIPAADGVSTFESGRYGRGAPGATSNCDNRYVWDGTATDGRTVAPGVYLARFVANGATTFRRVVFRGR